MQKVTIKFDEATHSYTDEYGHKYTSVTQLIHKFEIPFNHRYWVMYSALKEAGFKVLHDNKEGKHITVNGVVYSLDVLYSGVFKLKVTTQILTERWKQLTVEAQARGNETHNYLEDCVNSFYNEKPELKNSLNVGELSFKFKITNEFELTQSPLSITHKSIYDVLIKLIRSGYTIYAEKRVYSFEYKVSGTIDIIAVKGEEFIILDWKTNKDELKFEAGYHKKYQNPLTGKWEKSEEWVKTGDKLKVPINDLDDCKGNKYILQLSMYAYLCELWGLNCKYLILCHIRRTEEKEYEPKFYTLPYLKNHCSLILNYHYAS